MFENGMANNRDAGWCEAIEKGLLQWLFKVALNPTALKSRTRNCLTVVVVPRFNSDMVPSITATNTMLEGKGAKVGLITTKGFRDSLKIGRGV